MLEAHFKSRFVILQVLEDRGHNVDHLKLNFEEFKGKYKDFDCDELKTSLSFDVEDKRKTIVRWSSMLSLSKDSKKLALDMISKKIDNAIFIHEYITSRAKLTFKGLADLKKFVDCYDFKETLFNISKHSLVPKHELCSKEESDLICREYGIKSIQMPHLKKTDPMSRHFGARAGDVMKITRSSEIMKGYGAVVYRRVV